MAVKPAPWSFTSLSVFVSCPRKYHWEYVLKNKGPTTPEMREGLLTHKLFEQYVKREIDTLPIELKTHEGYIKELRDRPGLVRAERKIALNTKLQPCDSFDKNVFYRGVIDYEHVDDKRHHHIEDYKTGKLKPKPLQLEMNMVHAFAEGASSCTANFYWTKFKTRTMFNMTSIDDAKAVLKRVMPDLSQFAEAYSEDVWQPRQNGLCKGYCTCIGCEFHDVLPRRRR